MIAMMRAEKVNKPRVTITTEERYRRAFESHAAMHGMTPPELFAKLIADNCSVALAKVDELMDSEPVVQRKRSI